MDPVSAAVAFLSTQLPQMVEAARDKTGDPSLPERMTEHAGAGAFAGARMGPPTPRQQGDAAFGAAFGGGEGLMLPGTIADFERAQLPKLAEVLRHLTKRYPRLMRSVDFRPDESLDDAYLNKALGMRPLAEWRPPHPDNPSGPSTVGVSPSLETAQPGPFGDDPRLRTMVHELMHHAHATKHGRERFLTAYQRGTQRGYGYATNPWELLAEAAGVKRTSEGPMGRQLSIREAAARRLDDVSGGMRPTHPDYARLAAEMKTATREAERGARQYLPPPLKPLRERSMREMRRVLGVDETSELYNDYAVGSTKPTTRGFFDWINSAEADRAVEGDPFSANLLARARKVAGRVSAPPPVRSVDLSSLVSEVAEAERAAESLAPMRMHHRAQFQAAVDRLRDAQSRLAAARASLSPADLATLERQDLLAKRADLDARVRAAQAADERLALGGRPWDDADTATGRALARERLGESPEQTRWWAEIADIDRRLGALR
jgi:hypothetical protein